MGASDSKKMTLPNQWEIGTIIFRFLGPKNVSLFPYQAPGFLADFLGFKRLFKLCKYNISTTSTRNSRLIENKIFLFPTRNYIN